MHATALAAAPAVCRHACWAGSDGMQCCDLPPGTSAPTHTKPTPSPSPLPHACHPHAIPMRHHAPCTHRQARRRHHHARGHCGAAYPPCTAPQLPLIPCIIGIPHDHCCVQCTSAFATVPGCVPACAPLPMRTANRSLCVHNRAPSPPPLPVTPRHYTAYIRRHFAASLTIAGGLLLAACPLPASGGGEELLLPSQLRKQQQ